jgi:acetoin utilization protein AcuB
MLVRHVMTREVVRFEPDTRCRDALRVFQERKIRHAPVVDEGEVVGIVSERDLLRILPWGIGQLESEPGIEAEAAPVRRAMTREPHVIGPNVHLEDAARIMLDKRVSCLPVVADGELLGIITAADLFRATAENAGGPEDVRLCWIHWKGIDGSIFDPAAECVALGLRLTALDSYQAPGGERILTIRVRGRSDFVAALAAAARKRGCVLLDAGAGEKRRTA